MRRFLLLFLIFLHSCKSDYLGDTSSSDPESVFETLWHDIDQHCGVLGVRNLNWDSLYCVYRPSITNTMSQSALWGSLCSMLDNFNDSHVLLKGDNKYFSSRWYRERYYNYDQVNYLLSYSLKDINNYISCGIHSDRNIGYIFVRSFNQFDYRIEDIDVAINMLKDCRAIIVDVRENYGGMPSIAWRLSSWFSDNTDNVYYSQFRNGVGRSDFSDRREHRNFIRENNLSGKPVVLLTNSNTLSCGERFVLSMKTFKNVTHIGETTYGSFSAISFDRFLGNGWTYTYSIEKITLPDGRSLEGIGCTPDIYVVNTLETLHTTDLVLVKALDYLKDRYNI